MASLENRVLQMEHLCKQKDTEIRRLNDRIKELTEAAEKDSAPTPKVKSGTKRKAPAKKCETCGSDVYAIWHKRHVAECSPDKASDKGVVPNG